MKELEIAVIYGVTPEVDGVRQRDLCNRLRVSQHQVASGEYSGGYLKKAEFVYYSDSKPKEMDNQVDAVFDRKFEYDFAGRLSRSEFGLYTTQNNGDVNPHMQDVAYDAFSQVTSRETEQWGSASSFGRTYVNGRMAGHSGETLTYDPAGNITHTGVSSDKFQDTVYDAAGRRSSYTERWIITGSSYGSIVSERVLSNKFDGAGQLVKNTNQLNRISSPASTGDVTNTYTVHSSVLGGALSEISYVGETVIKRKTSIYAGGAIIAEQRRLLDDDTVVYFHADPVTGSKQEVRQTGESIDTREGRQEVEPFGQSIRTTPPLEEEPPANPVPIIGDSLFPEWQCALPTALIPTHCALKMIADIKGGGLWLGPTSTKNKEGNIARLSHESSHADPGRGGVALAAKVALSSAVTATAKPGDQEDGCSYGTDGGPNDCNVQSLPAASDPIEANNAENGGEPEPQILLGGWEREKREALAGATAILSGNSDCAKWFGPNGVAALKGFSSQLMEAKVTMVTDSDYLGIRQTSNPKKKFPTRFFDSAGKELESPTNSAYRLFGKVEIQITGPFVNITSRSKIGGNYAPASLESRIAQILHEVAHLAFDINRQYLIEDDGDSQSKSGDNTILILDDKKCRDAISAYMQQIKVSKGNK